jgi:hypothetical protein
MSWQRRGDFSHLIRTLRERHRYRDEIKWQHVRRSTLPFYKDLVSAFFRAPWLGFHALVVRRPVVRRELHASCDEARQKHFGMLLRAKIVKCLRAHPDRKQTVRVYVEPLHSSYNTSTALLWSFIFDLSLEDIKPTPEPATLMLLAIGGAGMLVRFRKRMSRALDDVA